MGGRVVLIAVGLALAGSRCTAADRTGFDLLGLRLAMTPAEIIAVLRPQSAAITESSRPCHDPAGQDCVESVTAKLPDGRIEVLFAHDAAWRISLTVTARGPRDWNVLRAAAIEHFGMPSAAGDVWCAGADEAGCPSDRPMMTLERNGSAAGVLTLFDPRQAGPNRQ